MGISVSESQIAIGLDMGGTGTKFAVVEQRDGHEPIVLANTTFEIDSEAKLGPDHVISTVFPQGIREAIQRSTLSAKQIDAIGVDFPAPVRSSDGTILDKANMNNPDWTNFNAGSTLRRVLPTAIEEFNPKLILVENDGVAGVAGVTSELPLIERDKLIIALFVGTGLGGGALNKGINPYNNESGGSEPGATRLMFDEGPYLFGKSTGSRVKMLEELVSLTAIERQLPLMHQEGIIPVDHEIMSFGATEHKSEWRVRAERLIKFADQALQSGDNNNFALKVFELQKEALGLYLQIAIQFQRPDHIFIGGGVVDSRRASPQFIEWFVKGVKDSAIGLIAQKNRRIQGVPEFHVPKDGDWAAPKGAALLALNSLAYSS